MADIAKNLVQGSLSRLDPRLKRLILAGSKYDSPVHRSGLAMAASELVFSEVAATASERIGDRQTVSETLRRVIVKHLSASPPAVLKRYKPASIGTHFSTAHLPINQIESILQDPDVVTIAAGHRLSANLDSAAVATGLNTLRQRPEGSELTGKGVIVGIIDQQFDLTLADFRDSDGKTRVIAYWDQTVGEIDNPKAADKFGYGTVHDRSSIDAAITGNDAHAELGTTQVGPEGHGTHVASIAAGNGRTSDANFPAGRYVGVASDAEFVLVQPSHEKTVGIAGDSASFTDSVHVADAIKFIFDLASDRGLPCVINMSLGQNGGSHDGASEVEQAIDQLLLQESRALVLAAGNEHTWRGHTSGTIALNQTRSIKLAIGGGITINSNTMNPTHDRSSNEIEFWYSSVDVIAARVISPSGETSSWVDPGLIQAFTFNDDISVVIDSDRFTPLNGDARITVSIHPKFVGPNQVIPIQPGTWKIEIRGDSVTDGRFDGWIERDARDPQNAFGDQAFFIGDDFIPEKTLGTPATSRRAICVANADHSKDSINASSSRGPTRDGRPKPDIAAPGTEILAANSRSGTTWNNQPVPARVAMSGTSMAAPFVAGLVALMLQLRPRLTSGQIAGILRASAKPVSDATEKPFDPSSGYGTVDALKAIDMVKAFIADES